MKTIIARALMHLPDWAWMMLTRREQNWVILNGNWRKPK